MVEYGEEKKLRGTVPSFALIVFYAFSAVLLCAALGVILVRNTVHAALLLVLAFVASAGVWMLLFAEFLAIVLVLVYVGAVMVLFLFVLMMLDANLESLRSGRGRFLSAAVALLVAAQIAAALNRDSFLQLPRFEAPAEAAGDNTRLLGSVVYTEYAYPFELAAVLLLVAMVAAVALSLRRRKDVKYTDPAVQMRASPAGRVRLVDMPSEKPPQTATVETNKTTEKRKGEKQ